MHTVIKLLVLILLFVSCTNNRSLPIAIDTPKYEPESFREEINETILDDTRNLKLRIKQYPLKNAGFEVINYFGDQQQTIYYRDFAFEVELISDNKILYSETFTKDTFERYVQEKNPFDQSLLSSMTVDHFNRETGHVQVKCIVSQIESDAAYIFTLLIEKNGRSVIALTDTH